MALDVLHEFLTSVGIIAEDTEHGAGGHVRVMFLHTANHGTHMLTFGDNGYAFGVQHLVKEVSDLARHALLKLQPPRKHIHNAGDFGKAENLTTRNVGHMDMTEKRQHMMFA